MLATPRPRFRQQTDETVKGVPTLASLIYTIDADSVDPVFFAVVPDSFMTRQSSASRRQIMALADADWQDQEDAPLLAPQDRWSF